MRDRPRCRPPLSKTRPDGAPRYLQTPDVCCYVISIRILPAPRHPQRTFRVKHPLIPALSTCVRSWRPAQGQVRDSSVPYLHSRRVHLHRRRLRTTPCPSRLSGTTSASCDNKRRAQDPPGAPLSAYASPRVRPGDASAMVTQVFPPWPQRGPSPPVALSG